MTDKRGISIGEKAARLVAEIQMLETRGYTADEMARYLQVSKRSINRDMVSLQTAPLYVPLWQDDAYRWHVNRA